MCWGTHSGPVLSITPYKKRSCTDVLFFLAFIAGWVAVIWIANQAIQHGGNPQRIIRGVDLQGRICGKDDGVHNKPYAAWPHPEVFHSKICLESCDETTTNANMSYPTESTRFLYYCIPKLNSSADVSFSGDFSSGSELLSRAMGDLVTAWPVIAGSTGIAMVVAFLYMFFVKRMAGVLVWSVILGIFVGGAFIGWSLLQRADEADGSVSDDRVKMMRYTGYAFIALTIVFAFVVFGMRDRIKLAIEIVKEASKAITRMMSMVFFPIFPLCAAVGYLAFWIVAALYIYSVANKKEKDTPTKVTTGTDNPTTQVYYERDTSFNNYLAYHFFHMLWNLQFFIYFSFMVIAGAVADWYFSPKGSAAVAKGKVAPAAVPQDAWAGSTENAEMHELSSTPVWDSVVRTLRFHIGTIAFGSLILAVVNFARALLLYIEEMTKDQTSRLVKCMFCCLQCCLSCLHCIADKISKNAFVWTAIYGDSFLPAASGSFQLLWANLARVAAISMIGSYLMLLGKLMVALLTTGACALIFLKVNYYDERLSSPVIPCLIIFLLAYAVAALFMVVYDTTIDTIFMCFLVDCEYNKSGTMLASESLQALIGRHQQESEERAAKIKSLHGGTATSVTAVETVEVTTKPAAK